MRNFGLLRTVVEKTIDGQDFIRISNQNENGEIINTHIYQTIKADDGNLYKEVFPQNLPYDITNKLSLINSYKPVDEIKSVKITKSLELLKDKILSSNKFEPYEFIDIDTVCDIFYILAKAPNVNFYSISSLIPNEFGVINGIIPVLSNELPYAIMDMLEKEDFKARTLLVYNNIFARIVKRDNKYCVLIYQLTQDKDIPDSTMKLNNIYTIVKEDSNYILVFDKENKYFEKLSQGDIELLTKDFIQDIGLAITK